MNNIELHDYVTSRALNGLKDCPKGLFPVDQQLTCVPLGGRQTAKAYTEILGVGILRHQGSPKRREGTLGLAERGIQFLVPVLPRQRISRKSRFTKDEKQGDGYIGANDERKTPSDGRLRRSRNHHRLDGKVDARSMEKRRDNKAQGDENLSEHVG
jgi:hypothetical protein